MADADKVKVDAIVVGGGPAGLAAAFTMAKAGLEVILMERGEYAGSKNMGGLFYGTVLNQLIPNFYEKAPIERTVSRRSISYLGDGQQATVTFGSEAWSSAPFNNTFIVYRAQFDRWLAKEVEQAGANLLEGTVVDDLIYEGEGAAKKAVGVRVRGNEEFYADAVILADGVNSLVTEKARAALGMKPGATEQDYAVGVKEVIGLSREKIEDRFNLGEKEGVAIDFIGTPFEGLIGGGFLYTGKESLHLGFAAKLESVVKSGKSPNEIMNGFKKHPVMAKYIRGGELQEYSAHLIPEGGYYAISQLAANGLMIAGDAAGFVNMSLYKEGTNLAMESGKCAAETVIEARKTGNFSQAGLQGYEKKLNESFLMKDLKKVRRIPKVLEGSPNLMSLYPAKATAMLVDFFSVGLEPKAAIQKKAILKFLKGLPKYQFVRDTLRARNLI